MFACWSLHTLQLITYLVFPSTEDLATVTELASSTPMAARHLIGVPPACHVRAKLQSRPCADALGASVATPERPRPGMRSPGCKRLWLLCRERLLSCDRSMRVSPADKKHCAEKTLFFNAPPDLN